MSEWRSRPVRSFQHARLQAMWGPYVWIGRSTVSQCVLGPGLDRMVPQPARVWAACTLPCCMTSPCAWPLPGSRIEAAGWLSLALCSCHLSSGYKTLGTLCVPRARLPTASLYPHLQPDCCGNALPVLNQALPLNPLPHLSTGQSKGCPVARHPSVGQHSALKRVVPLHRLTCSKKVKGA